MGMIRSVDVYRSYSSNVWLILCFAVAKLNVEMLHAFA